MKTSNKILLGTLLTVMLILTGIHVAMYAKFKSGDFTSVSPLSDFETLSIKPVKFVSIKGMDNVIIQPSKSYSMLKPRVMPADFHYVVSGDTLVVMGYTTTSVNKNGDERRRLFQSVTLMLPAVEQVFAVNSTIEIIGATDSVSAADTRFELTGSSLEVQNHVTESLLYFGKIEVNATDKSRIVLQNNKVAIASLICTLADSFLGDAPQPIVGRISVQADEQSNIQLNGTNLKKLQTAVSNNTATAQ